LYIFFGEGVLMSALIGDVTLLSNFLGELALLSTFKGELDLLIGFLLESVEFGFRKFGFEMAFRVGATFADFFCTVCCLTVVGAALGGGFLGVALRFLDGAVLAALL
jgi:hypothetical protein